MLTNSTCAPPGPNMDVNRACAIGEEITQSAMVGGPVKGRAKHKAGAFPRKSFEQKLEEGRRERARAKRNYEMMVRKAKEKRKLENEKNREKQKEEGTYGQMGGPSESHEAYKRRLKKERRDKLNYFDRLKEYLGLL